MPSSAQPERPCAFIDDETASHAGFGAELLQVYNSDAGIARVLQHIPGSDRAQTTATMLVQQVAAAVHADVVIVARCGSLLLELQPQLASIGREVSRAPVWATKTDLLAALEQQLCSPANPFTILAADCVWWPRLSCLTDEQLAACWSVADYLCLPRPYTTALAQHAAQRQARKRLRSPYLDAAQQVGLE
jgi:hypothetical protein